MAHPLVVRKGIEGAVYIGRPSKWGNPFVIGRDGDRTTVIAKYMTWVVDQHDLCNDMRRELKGKKLACFCAPLACHGDVIARIANEEN